MQKIVLILFLLSVCLFFARCRNADEPTVNEDLPKRYRSSLDKTLLSQINGNRLSNGGIFSSEDWTLVSSYYNFGSNPYHHSRLLVFENNYVLPAGYSDVIFMLINESGTIVSDFGVFNCTEYMVSKESDSSDGIDYIIATKCFTGDRTQKYYSYLNGGGGGTSFPVRTVNNDYNLSDHFFVDVCKWQFTTDQDEHLESVLSFGIKTNLSDSISFVKNESGMLSIKLESQLFKEDAIESSIGYELCSIFKLQNSVSAVRNIELLRSNGIKIPVMNYKESTISGSETLLVQSEGQ